MARATVGLPAGGVAKLPIGIPLLGIGGASSNDVGDFYAIRLAGTGDVYCNVGGVGSGRGSSAPTSGGPLGLGSLGLGLACEPA